ncbi:hypothetical protein UK23_03585 [Lentzea aerocolonigenes]|uniref:Uncharacterized protein n=1 Tax=Lentzea aerocolonigenes TaxID=68170 RepID=A0A0F0HE15_LENAE|nr:hypothetical protein [Lentzea aerocolonigenes]KJK52547.1 hypothetical protein UK23_03585 [Lentzea aerocolonigenes]
MAPVLPSLPTTASTAPVLSHRLQTGGDTCLVSRNDIAAAVPLAEAAHIGEHRAWSPVTSCRTGTSSRARQTT